MMNIKGKMTLWFRSDDFHMFCCLFSGKVEFPDMKNNT